MKKIAIIGSGISGLTCTYFLGKKHQVSLFECNDYLGGHTATIDVEINGKTLAIDTGFIVFNDRTYQKFIALMQAVGVEKQNTQMSFSVSHHRSGIEYNGHNLLTLFAQKRNLLRPKFYKFLLEILRFNRLAKAQLATEDYSTDETLYDFITRHQFSHFFSEHYLLPMVAAIWSSSTEDASEFPLPFFLKFFNNHGLFDLDNRPQWYVLKGGSKSYIPALVKPAKQVYLNTQIQGISRSDNQVAVNFDSETQYFDEVIFACHSDQALKLLDDASPEEKSVLGAIPYRSNEVVLHTDTTLLPRSRGAWASWNYNVKPGSGPAAAVTYNMNILQGLNADTTFCVTLNQTADIDPAKILRTFEYAHPIINKTVLAAQQRRHEICGINHTHFCGAYWYNGFHEDGTQSAIDVCKRFGDTRLESIL